jgi:hypothetical protein
VLTLLRCLLTLARLLRAGDGAAEARDLLARLVELVRFRRTEALV